MDVWWNNHFLHKDSESSNWNNHLGSRGWLQNVYSPSYCLLWTSRYSRTPAPAWNPREETQLPRKALYWSHTVAPVGTQWYKSFWSLPQTWEMWTWTLRQSIEITIPWKDVTVDGSEIQPPGKKQGNWKYLALWVYIVHGQFTSQLVFWVTKKATSWWFPPIWKILVKLDDFPKQGWKLKNIWNHHLGNVELSFARGFIHPLVITRFFMTIRQGTKVSSTKLSSGATEGPGAWNCQQNPNE